jgi:hypothetical protein
MSTRVHRFETAALAGPAGLAAISATKLPQVASFDGTNGAFPTLLE